MKKENFVKVMDVLDEYFNGEIAEAFKLLEISENRIADKFDTIISVMDAEVDPLGLARDDERTADCGSYVCAWLFSDTDFNEICPNAGALYDYIQEQYEKWRQSERDARAELINQIANS
jgi:hypothetical protein